MRPSNVRLGYWLIGLYIIGPIMVTLIDMAICQLLGYRPDESGMKPYVDLGLDIGGLLSDFFMVGFFSAFTIPTGLLALVFLECL
jgi:hypothetical protein